MVEWSKLFHTLLDRKIDCMFLRLMLYIYANQQCNVHWNGSVSEEFSVSNGVRQGAVSSALLFAVYIDDIIQILKRSKLGCTIDGIYFGVLIYADDILLLSASRMGLQSMVTICEKFASDRNLTFGTNPNPSKSKSKCIAFSKKASCRQNLAPIILNGSPLPWVEKVNHLGCTLECDNSMRADIALKRAKFIGKVNPLLQEFHFASKNVIIKLLNTYTLSFYGSPLWDLLSADSDRIYRSWNVTVRNVFSVDRETHRYLIEPLSECLHPKTILLSRTIGFYQAQLKSPNFCVRYLMRIAEQDQRTVIGQTLSYVMRECNLSGSEYSILSPQLVKDNHSYRPIPESEVWRPSLIKDLIETRDTLGVNQAELSAEEIAETLRYLCTE